MAKSALSVTYTSMLASSRDDAKRARMKTEALKRDKTRIQVALDCVKRIAAAASHGGAKVEADAWTSVHVYTDGTPVTICAYITIRDAKSLHDMAWKKAVFSTKICGLAFKTEEAEKQASEWSAGLRYMATRNIDGLNLEVTLRLDLAETGATCEKVQVGTKLVETPVYELRCN